MLTVRITQVKGSLLLSDPSSRFEEAISKKTLVFLCLYFQKDTSQWFSDLSVDRTIESYDDL